LGYTVAGGSRIRAERLARRREVNRVLRPLHRCSFLAFAATGIT
jgi:hypothetical protein